MQLLAIQNKIYNLRGHKVMLDFDLAELYVIETKRLKEAVRRNAKRFPLDFMFELTRDEQESLRSQIATLENGRGRHAKYLPFAFTEQGVAMLSSVLNSDRAIEMNIAIMRAFVSLRQMFIQSKDLAAQINDIRQRVDNHSDQLNLIYEAIENMLDEKVEIKSWEERKRIGFKIKKRKK